MAASGKPVMDKKEEDEEGGVDKYIGEDSNKKSIIPPGVPTPVQASMQLGLPQYQVVRIEVEAYL